METNLKDNIYIKALDEITRTNLLQYSLENIIYSGKTSEIPEEVAKKCVDSKYGETEINGKPITTYKNYSGYVSRLYPRKMTAPISSGDLNNAWEACGRLTTKYFYRFARESIKSACDKEYCIIYKR